MRIPMQMCCTLVSSRWAARCAVVIALCATVAGAWAQQAPPAGSARPKIYDTTADGGQQIAQALERAKRNHTRVLLQFGANWCSWCHKLHTLFKADRAIAREILYEYEVVLIDVDKVDGKPHNAKINERYGNPTRLGLPVLVVLDENGKQLTTQDTGLLEDGDHHDPAKVMAFLKKWEAKPLSAQAVLDDGLARAKRSGRKVFVYFSAPWCSWCHKLENWLSAPGVAKVFGEAYVPVKIDVDRMTGGKALDAKIRGADKGGIPFFAVLDTDGRKLADANGPDGNVGFPVKPDEIAHFMQVVRQTAGAKLTAEQLTLLEESLKKKQPS